MIRKLRHKFILVIMLVVSVLLAAAFVAVLVSTTSNLEHDTQFSLTDAMHRFDMPSPGGGNQGGGPKSAPRPVLSVETDVSGTVVNETNQLFNISDSDIQTIAGLALKSGRASGVLSEYSLRYLIQKQPNGAARLAFIDISMQRQIIRNLLATSGIVGLSTLLLFLVVSIFLSRWVVRPVEQAWNSQRLFVANASHELKTPLTVILSNITMLTNDMSSQESLVDDEKNRTRLENIYEESQRMKVLVDELLSIARLDSVSKDVSLEKVNLSAILDNVVLMFEPVLFDMGKRFDYSIAEDLTVMGNASKLRELAEILLDNACKYSLPGGLISVLLRRTPKNEIVLEVSNESETIPADELAKLFERFYRLDKARSSPGYGLGLSIAESIVREQGGKLWARSENGVTAFCVQFAGSRP